MAENLYRGAESSQMLPGRRRPFFPSRYLHGSRRSRWSPSFISDKGLTKCRKSLKRAIFSTYLRYIHTGTFTGNTHVLQNLFTLDACSSSVNRICSTCVFLTACRKICNCMQILLHQCECNFTKIVIEVVLAATSAVSLSGSPQWLGMH